LTWRLTSSWALLRSPRPNHLHLVFFFSSCLVARRLVLGTARPFPIHRKPWYPRESYTSPWRQYLCTWSGHLPDIQYPTGERAISSPRCRAYFTKIIATIIQNICSLDEPTSFELPELDINIIVTPRLSFAKQFGANIILLVHCEGSPQKQYWSNLFCFALNLQVGVWYPCKERQRQESGTRRSLGVSHWHRWGLTEGRLLQPPSHDTSTPCE